NWQIVRCEPAPHPLVLQVSMDAMCELVILAGIADEAGIVLDGLVQKQRQVVNEMIRQADPAQKRERQRPGFLQRAMIDDAWPVVDACFQAGDASEVNARQKRIP